MKVAGMVGVVVMVTGGMRVMMAIVAFRIVLFTIGVIFAVAAVIAFQQRADAGHTSAGELVDEAEDFRLEAEVIAERERHLRVLALQARDLRLDALDQHAGE